MEAQDYFINGLLLGIVVQSFLSIMILFFTDRSEKKERKKIDEFLKSISASE